MANNTMLQALIRVTVALKEYVDNKVGTIFVPTKLSQLQNDKSYATVSEIPTKVSQLNNDKGYITSVPDEYITETELNAKGYLTQHQSLTDYAKKSELHSHSNKSVLDGITSTKVSSWDNAEANAKSYADGKYADISSTLTDEIDRVFDAMHSHSNKGVLDGISSTNVTNWGTAYTHSQAGHAPSNAQKNSDITKAEIEAKLTGNITSHSHSQYLTAHQDLSSYATKTYVSTAINNTKYKSNFETTSWVENSTTGNYELTVTHNLNSEDLGLFVRDKANNCELFLDYQVTSVNAIKIVSNQSVKCTVKIIKF